MRKNQFRAFAGVAALSLCLGLGAAAMPANVKAATEHGMMRLLQIAAGQVQEKMGYHQI